MPPAINRKDRLVDAKIRDGAVLCLVQRREELDEEDDAVRAIPSLLAPNLARELELATW